MNHFYKNKHILGLCLIMLLVSSCSSSSQLVKDGDVYLFQGKEQIILSFLSEKVSGDTLEMTGSMVAYLIEVLPPELAEEEVFIEGLGDSDFYNFHLIADYLFFSKSFYKNKTLIYGYIASLYELFMIEQKKSAFIPLMEMQKIVAGQKISKSENEELLKSTVKYALDRIYFISTLEFLERPNKYFFPQKTKDELYQILVYPEILGYWKYLEFRFGKLMLLDIAKKEYSPEDFHVSFGEEVGELESAYVKTIEKDESVSPIIKENPKLYTQLTNTLELYMSGTKKSLMTE